jgi:hypothetical protein
MVGEVSFDGMARTLRVVLHAARDLLLSFQDMSLIQFPDFGSGRPIEPECAGIESSPQQNNFVLPTGDTSQSSKLRVRMLV